MPSVAAAPHSPAAGSIVPFMKPDMQMILSFGNFARTVLINSKPSMSGMHKSSRIRSQAVSSTAASASLPLLASLTQKRGPSRVIRHKVRTCGSSSTMRIVLSTEPEGIAVLRV